MDTMTEKKEQLNEDLIGHNNSPLELDEKEKLQQNLDLMAYNAEVSTRSSCCCVFSLQTGVMMIVIMDTIIFMLLICITGMTYENFNDVAEGETGIGFTVVTDGFCVLLFLIRLLYGLWYMRSVLCPPKMDYQYIVEFGKLKWHTKRVKNMRIYFKNYALAANVSSIFIFIQTLTLLIVLWRDTEMYFRYCFLLLLSGFTLMNLMTVYAHLKELDEQVTYRIRTYSNAVMARTASLNEKKAEIAAKNESYEAPRQHNLNQM